MYKACKKICLKSLYTKKLFNKKLETKKSPQKSSAAPGSESSSNHLLGERRDGHGENEMKGERETSKDVTGYSLTREWEERETLFSAGWSWSGVREKHCCLAGG